MVAIPCSLQLALPNCPCSSCRGSKSLARRFGLLTGRICALSALLRCLRVAVRDVASVYGRGKWLLSCQTGLGTVYTFLSVSRPLSVPQQFFSAFFIAGRTRSLLSLCRIAVRRILGKSRLDLIHILPIPDPIKQFLLHELS